MRKFNGTFTGFIQGFGVLRGVLAALVLATIVLAPGAGTPATYSGWGFVSTVLFAVLAPLCLMGLVLDMLMSRVLMSDSKGAERRRFRRIIVTEALLAIALVIRWSPYYLGIWRSLG